MATTALTAQTSNDYAAGATALVTVDSVFDTVPGLALYRPRLQERCAHYELLRAYYRGTVYQIESYRKALKLYAGIRQIFAPLRRAVRMDVAKVPGGWALAEGTPPPLAEAVAQVRAWSSARASYARAVLHGAICGEFGLLLVDDWRAHTVQIVPLRPDEVVMGSLEDGTPFGLVIKSNLVDRRGRYEYAQLITPREVRTFRSGQPYDYDGQGAQRPNRLGFVGLLLSPYLAGEDSIGECAFAGAYEQLDRANDAASQALDVVQRNAEPITVFSGVRDVAFDPANNAITLDEPDAKAYTLNPNLAIDQALLLIDKVLKEFKSVLPQLILDDLVSRNDLAYDTVVTLCMELIDHVNDVRTHVDAAIETAERWALTAGLQMGVFAGLDPALHRIDPDRPVIAPPPGQQLALEAQRVGVEGARRALMAPDEGARAPMIDNTADDAPQAGADNEE
jgi:hypothetical protein